MADVIDQDDTTVPVAIELARFSVTLWANPSEPDRQPTSYGQVRPDELRPFTRSGADVQFLQATAAERAFLREVGEDLFARRVWLLNTNKLERAIAEELGLPFHAVRIRVQYVRQGSIEIGNVTVEVSPTTKTLRILATTVMVLTAVEKAEDVIIKFPQVVEAVEKLQQNIEQRTSAELSKPAVKVESRYGGYRFEYSVKPTNPSPRLIAEHLMPFVEQRRPR